MVNDPYPFEHAPVPEISSETLLTQHAILHDAITTIEKERDAVQGNRSVGRELSLAITHLEDARTRIQNAIEAWDRQKKARPE